jgi:hypothetical protein
MEAEMSGHHPQIEAYLSRLPEPRRQILILSGPAQAA